jgi:hypothetical protein
MTATTRPQTRWEIAEKRHNTSSRGFSRSLEWFTYFGWCAHGCGARRVGEGGETPVTSMRAAVRAGLYRAYGIRGGAGDRRALAYRSEPTLLEEALTSSCWLT